MRKPAGRGDRPSPALAAFRGYWTRFDEGAPRILPMIFSETSQSQMVSKRCFAALAGAALASALGAAPAAALNGPPPDYAPMVARYARQHGVPERLIHRIIMRESRYRPHLVANGNYGLMQIRMGTARGMGYGGGPQGLLDAETNMRHAVPYLANAYLIAHGNEDLAVRYYAAGYYYAAKRQGLLDRMRTARSAPVRGAAVPVRQAEEGAPASKPQEPASARTAYAQPSEAAAAPALSAMPQAAEGSEPAPRAAKSVKADKGGKADKAANPDRAAKARHARAAKTPKPQPRPQELEAQQRGAEPVADPVADPMPSAPMPSAPDPVRN